MPIFEVTAPDGRRYRVTAPEGATQQQAIQYVQSQIGQQTITAPPAPQPEQSGVLRQILDVPLQIVRGGVGGIRMLADVFGAGSSASEALRSADTWLADLLSSQAKDDQRRIAEILKEAEDKGVLAQLGAGLRALATAPVDTLAQALGSTAPVIIAGLVSGPAGTALGLARAGAAGVGVARAGSVAMPAVGAAMGVGEVKGSVYEAVEQAYKEKGASDEVARAKALEAQSYASANLPSMVVGGGLGALAGGMGIERPLASMLGRGAVRDVAEQQALREADRGLTSRVGLGALREGAPEFAQAGQSQLAQNLALINEGFDVPLFRNVFGAGAMEGAAGAILGGGLAIPRSGVERLPGQRDGESDSDFARRMSLEIDAARRREQISPPTAPIAPVAPTVSTEDVYQFPDGSVGTMDQAKAYAMGVPVEQRQKVFADILSKRVPKEKTSPDLLTEQPTEAVETTVEPVEKPVEAEKPTEITEPPKPPAVALTKEEEEVAEDATKEKPVQNYLLGYPIYELPVEQLSLSKDVPQFKGDADVEGVVEKLEGTFDQRGVAPIQVWKRTDGRLEIISGRHRFDLAKRSGEKLIRAQIHEEATGFDADQASILDAELNIRDQQGKGRDYVAYFRKSGISEEDAKARGLLGRAPGKPAFAIAKNGSDELVAAHRADIVSDAGAAAIANAAPGDSRLQAVGVKAIQEGKSPLAAVNTIKAVQSLSKDRPPTEGGDLFGFDDSAMREAEEMAKIATSKQNQLAQRIAAISGASKRPEIAKKEGIDIKDPEALQKREKELRQQKAAWDNWPSSPELVEEIRKEMTPEAKPSVREAPEQKELPAEIQAKVNALGKALKRILTRYGLGDVAVRLVEDMKAEGEYASKVLSLALDATDPVVALRHEAIHALKELGFFTSQQWKSLERQAKEKWVDQYLKQKNVNREPLQEGQMSRYDAYMKFYGGDEEAIIEEAIADAFGDFSVKAPPGMLQAILKRLKNLFQGIKEAFGAEPEAERIFAKVERGELRAGPIAPDSWKDTEQEEKDAEQYEEQNGILPYTSAGQIEVPVETPKLSIKAPYEEKELAKGKENHPVLNVPLNANGTVTLYFPTSNLSAREVAKTKRLKATSPTANRIYLTNESNPAAVRALAGNIDQGPIEANVMVQVPPEMLQFDMEHSDGRKDFFIQLAEGNAFAEKMKMTKLFTLYKPRSEAIAKTTTIGDIGKGLESAVAAYKKMPLVRRKAKLKQARQVLKDEHNVGTLLGENGKLQKTRLNEYQLPEDIKNSVASLGLGLASAQKINERNLSTCPQSARCEGLCLGETSGQNQLYGGDGPFRAGPRLSQYLKTEALVMHPEEFGIVLYEEIKRFRTWAKSDKGFEVITDENGEKSRVKKQAYTPAIRLNVTSDFPPKMLKPFIESFPDVWFYDYTKLATPGPIAKNHHLTYSSDGAAQVVEGKTVGLGSNWNAMIKRLNSGFNVAMAFTSKNDMPEFVLDEKTGDKFQVWNGDNYDARFLDPRPGQKENIFNKGMIIGLTNKDRTGRPEDAALRHDGFFVEYDRERNGDTVVIRDQDKIKEGKKIIPISVGKARPSLRDAERTPKRSEVPSRRSVLDRIPELEQAAQGIKEGTVTRDQYEDLVNALKPVTPYTEVPNPASVSDIRRALKLDQLPRIGVPARELKAGDPVGLRLDIPAYANHGVWVVSVHEQQPGFAAGKSIGYESVAAVTNPQFGVVETGALNIAGGKPKSTIAVMKGDWKPLTKNQAIETAEMALNSSNWVQVGMDPTRHSYFYDRTNMEPVVTADEAVQIGPLVLAKNPIYGDKRNFKFSLRDQTQTPAFKKWFGDSKVVDENGEPLVVYHGTGADFSAFDPDRKAVSGGYHGKGFYFGDAGLADAYLDKETPGAAIMPVYLSMENPFYGELTSRDIARMRTWPRFEKAYDSLVQEYKPGYVPSIEALGVRDEDLGGERNAFIQKALRTAGYDGRIVTFAPDAPWTDPDTEYVVFEPSQIKSATGNIGTFDPTNPDIRYSLRDKLGLYSELENKLGQGPNTAPAAQWKSYINALPQKGVKPEEIQWSGVNDWLDLQGQPVPVYESGYGLMNEWQDTEGGKWTPVDNMDEYFRTKQEAEAAITDEMVQRQAKWAKEEGAKSRIVVTSFPGKELDFGKKMTPRISKEDILNYLKQGGVQVEETVLGNNPALSDDEAEEIGNRFWPAVRQAGLSVDEISEQMGLGTLDINSLPAGLQTDARALQRDVEARSRASVTKYGQYTLPGGENYREVLLTLPDKDANRLYQLEIKVNGGTATLAERQEYDDLIDSRRGKGAFRSNHWEQANVLAHIRVNDRTDADGNKVLFVEEIQSDWGQEGKKKGFRNDAANQKMFANESRIEDLESQIRDINFQMRGLPDSRMDEFNALADERQKLYDEQQRLGEEINLLRDKAAGEIAPAPFVTKTEGWLNLALKRVMVMAAEGGYDKVAFTTGEQNAKRFSLDATVEKINWAGEFTGNRATVQIVRVEGNQLRGKYNFNADKFEDGPFSGNSLEDVFGKEIAEKIAAKPAGGSLSGDGLKVEAKGMRAFYDTIVPTAVKKLLPKVGGGQMGEVQIQIPGKTNRVDRPRMESLQQPGFDVTPAMQDRVRTTGLPRFSLRDTVDVNGTPRPTTSSTGKPIYPTEEGTKNFWEWFGDSAVVDGEGRPLVVYHGTTADFSVFDTLNAGNITRSAGNVAGAFFSADPVTASRFAQSEGGNVGAFYLNITNPAPDAEVVKATYGPRGQGAPKSPAAIQAALIAKGYDGAYRDGYWIAFRPEQIKSAIGNVGKFDRVNPNIKASLRGTINPAVFALADQITTPRDDRSFIRRIIDAISPKSASHFRAAFLDRYDILSKYEKELVKQMGGAPLLADASAHAAALMSDTSAGVLASAMGVHDGVGGIPVYDKGHTYVINNNTVKGPIAIFAPLAKYNDPDIYRLYQTWAAVKRGIRLYGQGRPTGIIDPADQATIAALPPAMVKEFEDIQKEWITFNDGLVKYLVDTGVLSVDQGKEFVKYSDYIPFYRQAEGEKTVGPQIFASLSGVRQPKKLKESETPIGEFLETVIRNVQYSIEAGMKNVAAQRSVRIAESIGMAQRLNYVSSAPNVVKVLENGQTKYYAAQDMLFVEAMKSLNLGDLPFIGLLTGPANLLRALVTKDPAFMLANMMRDSMSAWVSTGVNMTPMIDTLTNFTKALAGNNPEYAALLNSGVIGGYDYSQGLEASAERFNRELRKAAGVSSTGEKLAKPFTSLWDALEKGTTASDAATRMEIYKKTLAETGNEAEAIFRALEVMNFNRKGNNPLVRVLTAAVPFLNARMQGLDVLYRAAFAQGSNIDPAMVQKRFFVRGMTIAALSAMYWVLVHEDDEWKKQEQETRDNYWILGDVKIPIPFEIGVLFKVIPERILEYSFGNDTGKDFMKSMARQLTNTLAFNPLPQTALPIIESVTNYSFFTQRPIVSQGLEDVAPAYQIAPGTSRIGELAGEATKGLPTSVQLSPVKVDALIRGYTGTIGGYMMDLFDAIYDMNSDAPKAAKRFEQMPVIRRFAVDPEARGQVTAYYELKNAVDEATRTANLLERNMNPQEWGEFMEQNMGLLATKDYVLDLEKSMKQYRDMKNMVRASTMDADEKKDVLLDIIKLENQLASNIQEIKKMIAAQ